MKTKNKTEINMLTINIICTGKIKEKYLQEAVEEYTKRLSKYCKLNIIDYQMKSCQIT